MQDGDDSNDEVEKPTPISNTEPLESIQTSLHAASNLITALPDANGHSDSISPSVDGEDSTRRGSKRKHGDISGIRKTRAASPPWKKVEAEGPTSFIEGGRRKSGRVNMIPLELQPQSERRTTRRAYKKRHDERAKPVSTKPQKKHWKTVAASAHGVNKDSSSAPSSAKPSFASSKRQTRQKEKTSAPTRQYRRQTHSFSRKEPYPDRNGSSSPQRQRKKSARWLESDLHSPTDTRANQLYTTRSSPPNGAQDHSKTPVPRLRLRFKPPPLPILHPGNVCLNRKHSNFQEFLQHDDPLSTEEDKRLTTAQARHEANTYFRIEGAAKPGGVLSDEDMTSYSLSATDEPSEPHVHPEYVVAHAQNFLRLLRLERSKHMIQARALANEAQVKWKKRQPLSDEQKLQAQRKQVHQAYRSCMRELQRRWSEVAAIVRRQKLKDWEEQQKAHGNKALQDMLQRSTNLLSERRKRSDFLEGATPDGITDVSEDNLSNTHSEDELSLVSDEEDTSSSDETEDMSEADVDAGLSAEELKQKYADLEDFEDYADTSRSNISRQASERSRSGSHSSNTSSFKSEERSKRTINPLSIADSDPLRYQLEEVPDELLDHSSDDSITESDTTSSSDGEGANEETDEGSEGSEDDTSNALLGFLSQKDRHALLASTEKDSDTDLAEQSDFHDLNKPIATTAKDIGVSVLESSSLPGATDHDATSISDDPRTSTDNTTAKPSEAESVSSVEPPDTADTPKDEIVHVKTDIPHLLRGTLREYQHHGLDWLAGMYANDRTNGILADEMGLGKTIQTIALLAHLATQHHVWGPHLVVVPTSVMLNWEMEFKKWCPGFKILTYYGTIDERRQKRKGWMDNDKWNVLITSYQLALQDSGALRRRGWHYIILDEAHNIKNFRSQRWQTLLNFRSEARLLLTGTPLQNNLTELWSLLFFLDPSRDEKGEFKFSDLSTFQTAFRRPASQILDEGREAMDEESKATVAKLHEILRPHLLRRLKADVEKQMPKKYEHIVKCRLSKRQRQLYDGYMGLAGTRESFASGNYLSIINCLMQLRKVCNHPDLFETRQIVTSFAMPRAAVADFEIKELLVRRRLFSNEPRSRVVNLWGSDAYISDARKSHDLAALRLMKESIRLQGKRVHPEAPLSFRSFEEALTATDHHLRDARLSELYSQYSSTASRTQRYPLYSRGLLQKLDFRASHHLEAQPTITKSQATNAYLDKSDIIASAIQSRTQRYNALESIVKKFSCITPIVTAANMTRYALTDPGIDIVGQIQGQCPEDPFHESRVRLSIAFPDKGLIQYDCGKLQQLAILLRQLQSRGSRALIFTQMTKVLDILERFLNLHGHRYLRLDGATKIEQRQILTDRFNNDSRILAFILSSRSGGLGVNLTGADTVIFYDLDWNPAMDKQCQDRCHRIGQTRDVHIYRFVCEGTIEANILRKSNQKRMLDDVVIQEGEFTTEHFNRLDLGDLFDNEAAQDGHAEADSALDMVLGTRQNNQKQAEKMFEQAEDVEDQRAAQEAQKEIVHLDDEDFNEGKAGSGAPETPKPAADSPAPEMKEYGARSSETPAMQDESMQDASEMQDEPDEQEPGDWGEYMVRFMKWVLKDTVIVPAGELAKRKPRKVKDQGLHIRR